MIQIQMPENIKMMIGDKPYKVDDIGMSGNQVLIFDDMVLKIEEYKEYLKEYVRMMRWLEGKLPIPQILAYEEVDGKSYLLMSRI